MFASLHQKLLACPRPRKPHYLFTYLTLSHLVTSRTSPFATPNSVRCACHSLLHKTSFFLSLVQKLN
ncbi:hypothetical protein E2C01_032126 [Portunus trituberculatus]|uniref:Uncharacterized protein n=1 Tax=Portunus trituberculatus TaxID=210409 RepID=A0A5B7EYV7_PORTR|nr:hypothetical protein [Portunus trituberculatus]